MADRKFKCIKEFNSFCPKVNDKFKEALFLSKGKSNNAFAHIASQTDMSAADVAKYFSNLTSSSDGVPMSIIRSEHPNKREKLAHRCARSIIRGVPKMLDTTYGLKAIENLGEERVRSITCQEKWNTVLSIREFRHVETMVHSHAYNVAYDYLRRLSTHNIFEIELMLRSMAALNADDVEKLEQQKISIEKLFGSPDVEVCAPEIDPNVPRTLRSVFLPATISALKAYANIETIEGDAIDKLQTSINSTDVSQPAVFPLQLLSSIQHQASGVFQINGHRFGVDGKYNSLYIKGMFDALDELGAGILATKYCNLRPSRVSRIAKKIISLNEKYQKAVKSSRNSIEPAVIRQTIVDMFNNYSKDADLRLMMFTRADKPAPKLEQKKKKASAEVKRSKTTAIVSNTTITIDGKQTEVKIFGRRH